MAKAEKLLVENLNKCRCCFRMVIDDAVPIDEEIRSQFFELTEIEVNSFAFDGIKVNILRC